MARKLLLLIVFVATLCDATLANKKVKKRLLGLSSLSTIGNARAGEAGGKISSSAGLLDERDVFGEIFAGRVVIFTDISQGLMVVVGEWIAQWVVNFFTGDLFHYAPFAS